MAVFSLDTANGLWARQIEWNSLEQNKSREHNFSRSNAFIKLLKIQLSEMDCSKLILSNV